MAEATAAPGARQRRQEGIQSRQIEMEVGRQLVQKRTEVPAQGGCPGDQSFERLLRNL